MNTVKMPIRGAGGMMGGKSSSSDKNDLFANSTAEIVYVISDGPIKGGDGLKSLYIDGTRVKNDADEIAIKGVTIYTREGYPTQSAMSQFDGVSTVISVGTRVYKANPVTRSLSNAEFTSCVVTVQFPSLVDNTDDGLKKTSVTFRIEVAYNGGAFINPFGTDISVSGKTTSSYEEQYTFKLPANPSGDSAPWSVRVTRLTADSDSDDKANETWLSTLTGIIDRQMSYPDTALLGLKFDAKEFSGSVPQVEYIADGLLLQVPTNYDPETRTYSGTWSGAFKTVYSNNPAWFYYTLARDKRFGAGRFLDTSAIDKWSLYAIAQICDEEVDDGYGGKEPRFAINAYITEEQELYDMMQLVASAFRGMSYWSSGAVTATIDTLDDPKVLVTRANTIGGEITYASSSLTARHTVAHVKYKDARDEYRDAVEVVRDEVGILRYGERIKEIDAFGCTSRAAARRLGRWMLLTELYETETVTYQAGLDHAVRRPGDVVSIMDPEKSAVDFAGRTAGGNTTTIVNLDRQVVFTSGITYQLHVTLPDGTLATKAIINPATAASQVTLTSALPAVPLDAAVWVISSSQVEPKPYRILSIIEREPTTFEITALEIYAPKYTLIDAIGDFDEPSYRDPVRPEAPSSLTVKEVFRWKSGVATTQLMFSWKSPSTMYSPLFRVEIDTPNTENEYIAKKLEANSYTIDDGPAGDYTIRVYSLSPTSPYRSQVASATFTAQGNSLAGTFTIENVEIEGESGSEFFAKALTLRWRNKAPNNASANSLSFQQARVEVYDNTVPASPVLMGTHDGLTDRFAYSWSLHKADALSIASTPKRKLLFKVYAQDTLGRWGAATAFEAYNNALAAPGVAINGGILQAFVSTIFPTDKDLIGQKIYMSTSAAFTPAAATLVYDGSSDSVVIPVAAAGTYYFKIGLYDSWSATPANVTPAIGVTVTAVVIDITPPAVPTGLALTSSVSTDADGSVRTKLVCDWSDNAETDLAGYDLEIKEASGSYIGFPTTQSRYEINVSANTSYTAHVRARDTSGNVSAYCTAVSLTTAKDTTAPAVPTGLTASAGFNVIWLSFTGASDADLDHYDVYESATATPVPTAATAASFKSLSTTTSRAGLANGVTRYYWVRSVDTSGNASAWVGPASATTVLINVGDIIDGAVTAAKLTSTLKAVEIVSSLPTTGNTVGRVVFLTTDNKLYRYNGTAWVSTVPSTDISGQLTDDQLAAIAASKLTGQIVASQIADAAITTAKFASSIKPIEVVSTLPTTGNTAGRVVFLTTDNKLYRYTGSAWVSSIASADISGTITAAQIAGLEASKITGTLTDDQLAAISAAKISGQLTDAQIAAIAASKLTGQIVATQIADGAVNTAKFASSIKPIEVVSTLPSTGNTAGRVVFLTTDNKLYRYTGSAWVSSIASADISGTITAAQIAGLEASKITGTLTDAQIAAVAAAKVTGQITSTQITDDAITTPKIAAGAVTASEIAANTITAAQIAAGTITATQIATGAITAAKIAAGAVQASSIAAGAVTADAIAANSVDASKIVANTITAGQIAAGAISATEIAAGAVTADKLVVTDWTNLVENANFEAGDKSWTEGTGAAIVSDSANAYSGNYLLRLSTGATVSIVAHSNRFSVRPGDTLYAEAWLKASGTTVTAEKLSFRIRFMNASGNAISAPGTTAAVTTTSYTKFTVISAVPSTAVYAWIDFIPAATLTTTVWNVGYTFCHRQSAGELIVDGAVTADKIAANTITAAQIAAGTITASEIAAATITGAKIAAGTISASNLVANTITAAQIAAGTITATQIATGAITAAKIAAGAVQASSIAAGAVTADAIAANSIDASKIVANSITAGQIAAGAISTTELAAGAVTASKLFIGDTSNIVPDADMVDTASWSLVGATTLSTRVSNGATASKNVLYTSSSTTDTTIYSVDFTVEPGKVLWVSGSIGRNTGDSVSQTYMLGIEFFSDATATTSLGETIIATVTGTSWYTRNGQVTAPATCKRARVFARKTASASAYISMLFAGAVVRRAASGELIVDGAVTADKIAANTITAAQIAAQTITTNEIAANTITASNISAGAITATQIASGTITATQIAANTITAGQIAAGAISATEIAAGAILASKLTIGDTSNAWLDPDLLDASLYSSSTGSAFTIPKNSSANYSFGYIYMSAAATTADMSVESAWQQCETGADYYASIVANLTVAATGGESVEAYISLGSLASTGVVTETRRVLIGSRNSTSSTPLTVTLTTTTSEKRFRFVFISKVGTGTGRARFSAPILRRRANSSLIVDGSITALKLVTDSAVITGTAQIANAIITGAQISSATITAANIADATITSAKIVSIDASKIIVSGSTALSSWCNGSDSTLIEGGKIAANTISANKMEIGSRGLSIEGLEFEHNSPSANYVSWTAGAIKYVNDAGTVVAVSITAGNAAWSSGTLYVYWTKDATTLSTSSGATAALAGNGVIFATYKGGVNLVANYGRTIIDGSNIKTGTITANQISAGAITTSLLAAGAVTATTIAAGAVSASKLSIGDTSNIIPDPDMVDLAAWTVSGATTLSKSSTSASVVSQNKLYTESTTTDISIYSTPFQVEPSKSLWVYGGIGRNGGDAVSQVYSLGIEFFSDAAATVSLGETIIGTASGTSWATKNGQVTAPATARRARVFARKTAASSANVALLFVGPIVRRAASGELIVDGAVTADKIAANTITATQIAAGTITATEIAASTITAAKIAAGTITATQIATGAITAAKIAAGTITSDKLSVSTLSAITANLGTVTAGIINASSGQFSINLNAGTITYPDGSVQTSAIAAGAISSSSSAYTSATVSQSGGTLYVLQTLVVHAEAGDSVTLKGSLYFTSSGASNTISICRNGTEVKGITSSPGQISIDLVDVPLSSGSADITYTLTITTLYTFNASQRYLSATRLRR